MNSETTKLLVICGPTATGKTALALHLSKVFSSKGRPSSGWDGEVLSADSRQVYKMMDIGTGKDLPKNVRYKMSDIRYKNKPIGYYILSGVKIWGHDLVDPKEEFSVSHFVTIANNISQAISDRGKLPILVGGTGLYIKGVVDGIPTINIPRNIKLRKELEKKEASELYDMVIKINPVKAESMTNSDRKNPRRLIRALEIGQFNNENKHTSTSQIIDEKKEVLFIGLTAPMDYLSTKIDTRVKERIKQGFNKEVESLLAGGVNWKDQSMQALGYRHWQDYLSGKKTLDEVIRQWIKDEKNYAKRQFVWFKKDKRIQWFDVSEKSWEKDVEKIVGKWYSSRKRL